MGSMKNHFNELSREIAYSGPILCRPKYGINLYGLRTEVWSFAHFSPGEVLALIRGPKPSGGHKERGGDAWIFITSKGIRFMASTTMDLDTHFTRVL